MGLGCRIKMAGRWEINLDGFICNCRVKEACFVDLQYCDGRTETVSEIMIAEGIAKVGMLWVP